MIHNEMPNIRMLSLWTDRIRALRDVPSPTPPRATSRSPGRSRCAAGRPPSLSLQAITYCHRYVVDLCSYVVCRVSLFCCFYISYLYVLQAAHQASSLKFVIMCCHCYVVPLLYHDGLLHCLVELCFNIGPITETTHTAYGQFS